MTSQGEHISLEHAELLEHEPGVENRIDTDLVAAPVSRAPVDLDLDPRESLVRRHDRETRGLSDDRRIGAYAPTQQLASPHARVLFVGDGRNDDLSLYPARRRARGRGAHRGKTALHVGSATCV